MGGEKVPQKPLHGTAAKFRPQAKNKTTNSKSPTSLRGGGFTIKNKSATIP